MLQQRNRILDLGIKRESTLPKLAIDSRWHQQKSLENKQEPPTQISELHTADSNWER